MKLRSIITAGALAAAVMAPSAMLANTAAAQSTTQVWVANAYEGVGAHLYSFTVCLDGNPIASGSTGDTSGPTDVTPGSHTVDAVYGLDAKCSATPDFSSEITIPEGAGATIALWYPPNTENSGAFEVFPEDMSCVPSGTGRVVLRNLSTSNEYSGPVDLVVPGAGSAADNVMINGVQNGAQGSAMKPTGDYANAQIVESGTKNIVSELKGADLSLSESNQQIVYAYGGMSYGGGTIVAQIPTKTCEAPATTSVAPSTTSTPVKAVAPTKAVASAATPHTAQPAYTG